MTLLLIAGIGVILAGVLAIGFGIPVKEFGFGNTLILTGTIGACTGLIMISMAVAVRELKKFAPQPGEAIPVAAPRPPKREAQPAPEADDADEPSEAAGGPLFSRDLAAAARAADGGAPPPWQEEAARTRAAPVVAPDAAEPEEPKRRNLLFSSTRRERERADAEAAAAQQGATENAAPEPSKGFEDAWPNNERPRGDAFRRAARAPSTFSDAPPDEQLIPARYEPPVPPKEDAAAVTVLKSGVVDGMAYSLYSDGSIEAQMPEGMMRFASIDELRDHLDQRG
jgi:hypothetical protein